MKIARIAMLAAALLAAPIAWAQTAGTITFTASKTSGASPLTTVLTWSTSPAATGCAASGAWSGVKAASGTQTLTGIVSQSDYTLTCSWPGALGSALLSWVPPTTNTDGTSLVDLARFRIYYGLGSALTQTQDVPTVTATSVTVSGLAAGTWSFAVRAINASNMESDNSNIVTKAIAAGAPATASKTVTVTPDKVPSPPTNLTVTEAAAYYVRPDLQRWAFLRGGRYDGRAKLGSACDELRATADGYTVIARPSRAVDPRPPAGTVLVARCG